MPHFAHAMSSKECINRLSKVLFWDVDMNDAESQIMPQMFVPVSWETMKEYIKGEVEKIR